MVVSPFVDVELGVGRKLGEVIEETSDRLKSYIYGALKRDVGTVALARAQTLMSSVSCG